MSYINITQDYVITYPLPVTMTVALFWAMNALAAATLREPKICSEASPSTMMYVTEMAALLSIVT